MDGYKNAFRIIMGLTALATLGGLASSAQMISQVGGGMPIGVLLLGACTQALQIGVVWIPAEVLFDLHDRVSNGFARIDANKSCPRK